MNTFEILSSVQTFFAIVALTLAVLLFVDRIGRKYKSK